ncbi:hypothetical protein [Carboxylicivirga caseinilyticus]|uniref:hypothetical protein n=1 Tax=Carboxylicivirga caseinilyticus TaxID=3417572 RepID=UPI003D327959|nr:hypothetical protein [Marinilabiliaceae bacterium A049]
MINLIDFFKTIEYDCYCIIKIDDKFPEYSIGDDIDIFCFDISHIIKNLLIVTNQYIDKGFTAQITKRSETHTHFDILNKNKIEIRFDLYQQFPGYKNLNIKKSLFDVIIEKREKKMINNSLFVYVPNKIDELILRYIEYHEWYAERPDKIKHIEYILKNAEDKTKFLDRIHHYTALPKYHEHKIIIKSDKQTKRKINIRNTISLLKKSKHIHKKSPKELFRFIRWNIIKHFK